jgi:SAM-dependent methyltransferase
MGFRELAQHALRQAGSIPLLDSVVLAFFRSRAPQSGFNRVHPFDRLHGVDSGGSLPDYMLGPGATAYGAAQPSIIRRALSEIPDRQSCQFFDFGCGKGRPLLVAMEFKFAGLTGLEYSPALSRVAARNAAIFSRANPGQRPIKIVTGDALAFPLPDEPITIFLYNSFRQPLMERFIGNLEALLKTHAHGLYVIYYNPVWASILDASPALERRFAAQIPYQPDEAGYGPESSDAVVIWQNRGNANRPPPGDLQARVIVVSPDARAELAAAPG